MAQLWVEDRSDRPLYHRTTAEAARGILASGLQPRSTVFCFLTPADRDADRNKRHTAVSLATTKQAAAALGTRATVLLVVNPDCARRQGGAIYKSAVMEGTERRAFETIPANCIRQEAPEDVRGAMGAAGPKGAAGSQGASRTSMVK